MPASQRARRILMIEGDATDAEVVRRALSAGVADVTGVNQIDAALVELDRHVYDAVLMDLAQTHPSSSSDLKRVQEIATDLPVIVYGKVADPLSALDAVRMGAQDYLHVDQIDAISLSRSIAYSIERMKVDRILHDIAYRDALTGLPNRMLLFDRMSHALAGSKRRDRHIGVLFINLDGFKAVNETLGLAGGDDLLQQAGTRLRSVVRESDTVARVGGDEFVVLLTDIQQAGDASLVASMLVDLLDDPFLLAGRTVCVSASIGIAVSPHDGTTADELLRSADAATSASKHAGGKGFRFHSTKMNAAHVRRLDLAQAIREALAHSQFQLHYMPIVEKSCRTLGLEALIRWNHPSSGFLSPDLFIPDAERMRMIVPIGTWVIREACRQQSEWCRLGLKTGRISVNLSPHQLIGSDVPQILQAALDEFDVPPEAIGLEVTETVVMANEQRAVLSLRRLHDMGIHIALDDFGTGYSSLSHLRMLPIDSVKIDRSFVSEVTSDSNSAAIVKGMILVVHGIGKTVVAEGVETTDQMDFLLQHGCDAFQGYLFSKGLPAEELPGILQGGAMSLAD